MARSLAFLLLGLTLASCAGRGAIFLTIEASGPSGVLRAPDDLDRLVVRVTDRGEARMLLEKEFPLSADHKFPLTLGLEPEGAVPNPVRIAVGGYQGERKAAEGVAVVSIAPEVVTSITIRIISE